MAAAIAYAFWAGRERARAYFGLMLFLTGAIVGVFTAQDLLLFYVFFEAMLIPLYVLVGVWGGPGRLGATLKFVDLHDGGLAADARVDRRATACQQETFDLVDMGHERRATGSSSASRRRSPSRRRSSRCHGWLPDAYRESSPEVAAVLSGVVSKAAAYGFLRIAIAKFPEPVAGLPRRRSSRSRRSGSSTARCSRSARPTSAA